MHPEAEMSRYLTAQGFANTPPMLGEVVRAHEQTASARRSRWRRASCAIRAMPGRWTLDQFNRALDDLATREADRRRSRRRSRRLHAPSPPRSAGGSARCTRCWRVPSRRSGLRAGDRRRARCRSMGRARGRAARARVRPAQEAIELGQRDGRGARPSGCCRSRKLLTRALRRLAKAGVGTRHNPHPRRLPPRPGAGRERRRLHHRFRGRARPAARRAARQGEPVARCRGPVALVRLCGGRDARSEAASTAARVPHEQRDDVRRRVCATARSARSSMPIGTSGTAMPAAASCSTSS